MSIADRATIANMCPEYGATAAFFPVDEVSIRYLVQTGKCRTVKEEGKVWQNAENWSNAFCLCPLECIGSDLQICFLLSVESK